MCAVLFSYFPVQKFATGMLESRLNMSTSEASGLFSFFPIGAMVLTPLLGWFIDSKVSRFNAYAGFVAGSDLSPDICTYACERFTFAVALSAIILLGISFSGSCCFVYDCPNGR